ncbi:MAG: LysM peptidoglycan-binding domain-containing protein [Anaerolineae bacterium]
MPRNGSRSAVRGLGAVLGLTTLCLCGALALAARGGDKSPPTTGARLQQAAATATPAAIAVPATATAPIVVPSATVGAPTPAATVPAAQTAAAPTATSSAPTAAAATDYTIVAGDSLSGIARELGVSLAALAGYNEIENPSRINVGQVLEIPPADYVPPTATVTSTPEPLPPTDTPAPEVPTDTPVPPAAVDTPAPVETPTVEAAPTPEPAATSVPAPTPVPQQTCCKVCHTGKACGNSCINRNYTCHQPPGCACNG